MRIVTTERVHRSSRPKADGVSRTLNESPVMTLIEIRPDHCGWKVFEALGVEPVFPEKDQAINYAAEPRELSFR